jgi:hypothetical protein
MTEEEFMKLRNKIEIGSYIKITGNYRSSYNFSKGYTKVVKMVDCDEVTTDCHHLCNHKKMYMEEINNNFCISYLYVRGGANLYIKGKNKNINKIYLDSELFEIE